jgi:cyclophilin family peptidyl-prolyl cis-trans isomerase
MKILKRVLGVIVLLSGGAVCAVPSADGLYATLQTTMGDICFELYYTNAPQTVANFVSLAEGSRPWIDPRTTFISNEPYYNGIIFHRVVDGFMIQAGSPKKDGKDGPGYTFEDEFDPALRHNRPGIVSMANSGFDSNGGQFFITVGATPLLDDVHSVFGAVVEGMHIVSNIAAVATNSVSRPLVDITITNAFITRNGFDAQQFEFAGRGLPEVLPLPMAISSDNGTKLSAGTAASSYQYVYSSTNLNDWSEAISQYWSEPSGNWVLTASGETREFFRANRVSYTPNTNMTADVANHYLVITLPERPLVLQATLGTGNTGVFNYEGFPDDSIVSWSWDKRPYQAVFFVGTDFPEYYTFFLHYSTPASGRCKVYYYNNGWRDWGNGTFTDQDLN